MILLDRYIASSYLKGMVPVMLLLLTLFSFMAMAEELEEVGEGTFRLIDAFLVVLYTSPRRIVDLMPVTALLGGLMGLGAMANHQELIAARVTRMVVLPFRNKTRQPGAGQAAADLASWSLVSTGGVTLIESGDATRRLLERGWRTGMPMGTQEILSLGLNPGVDSVMMGSVDHWMARGRRRESPTLSCRRSRKRAVRPWRTSVR